MTYRDRAYWRLVLMLTLDVILIVGGNRLGWLIISELDKLHDINRFQLTLIGLYISLPIIVVLSQAIAVWCIRAFDFMLSGLSPAQLEKDIIHLTEHKEYLLEERKRKKADPLHGLNKEDE